MQTNFSIVAMRLGASVRLTGWMHYGASKWKTNSRLAMTATACHLAKTKLQRALLKKSRM
jgi:hypothetical protein